MKLSLRSKSTNTGREWREPSSTSARFVIKSFLVSDICKILSGGDQLNILSEIILIKYCKIEVTRPIRAIMAK